jgi:tetratricopeptide (TPR) repeat protein
VSSKVTGGVFFGAVIQGRDIQVMLPAQVTPAMTGLPRPAAVFTGRDGQVDALLKGLSPDRQGGAVLVTAVAGMAGIGKTELVLQTAHRALRTTGWFPGGVLFVDLFGYDPARRLSAADALLGWLQAIGIPGDHIPAAEADRARLWRSVLAAYLGQGRRPLLVIDNAADAGQVAPLLPADADIPVLITSRHNLDIDARLYDLDVLDTDSAVDLVREVIAHRRGPVDSRGRDRQAMVELVGLCAGLPLALRVVAALLADRPHLQPAALAQELRDQHRLDRLSREQVAVRAAFDLSYQHLTDAQARLFRLLPVNPGPDVGTTATARLADLPEQRATILLQDLHRAHLVDEPAPDRWGMHDLLRLHAGTQSPATPDEATTARLRLFTHYHDSARAANTHLDPTTTADTARFATREQALTWLDAEHSNLIAVCTSAPGHQLPKTSTDLAFTLARFLDFRRYFDDWITITTTAADIFQQAGDRHGEGQTLNNLGLALQQVRRFDEAITAHTQAAKIHQQTGDRRSEGGALNNLGLALRQVRRVDEAITAHTQAAKIHQQTGDRRSEGGALNNLGLALQQLRRVDEAITAHTQAAKIHRQTGDRHSEGTALNNLGLALQQLRRFDEAITAHTQDLEICWQTGDRHGEGTALSSLGLALRQVRRFDDASSCWAKAVDAFTDAGDAASAALVRQWLDELPHRPVATD